VSADFTMRGRADTQSAALVYGAADGRQVPSARSLQAGEHSRMLLKLKVLKAFASVGILSRGPRRRIPAGRSPTGLPC